MSHQQASKQALARTKNHSKGYKFEPVYTDSGWKTLRVGSVEWRKWQ